MGEAGEHPRGRHAEALVEEFFARVWGPSHELEAIDDLMTEDYTLTTAGRVITGREAFKAWVAEFQTRLADAANESLEVFVGREGTRVVSRWVCKGTNNGVFGLPADGRPVSFTGIAIWAVRDGRMAECWVERSGLEAYRALAGSEPTERLQPPGSGGPAKVFEHMVWADRRLLHQLVATPDARKTAGALRLLSHTVAAERVWLMRAGGEDTTAEPIWPDWSVEHLAAVIDDNFHGYAALADAAGDRVVSYANSKRVEFRTRLEDILAHVALHGSYHRGQVAAALRAAGVAPPNTDYITYVRERG
jgi:steroid delta-isomerase-like uncharacterized protein